MNSKLLLIAVSLFHGVSFSMIVHYKNKENQERFQKSATWYGKRIAAKIAQEEKKRWEKLSEKERGFCKLEKLYKHQNNPRFVANFLIKNAPSVLVVNTSDPQQKMFVTISPYDKDFYREPSKQIFDNDISIITIGKYLAQKAISEDGIGEYYGDISRSLNSAVIFGDDKDIRNDLQELDNKEQSLDNKHTMLYGSLLVALNYDGKKNSALELLLTHERNHTKKWMGVDTRVTFANSLLRITASNKQLFELISYKDPYNVNREIFIRPTLHQPVTLLELMKEKKDIFDQEHIDIFMREGGGMTVAEVKDMQMVDRILNKRMTLQERDLSSFEFWQARARDINNERQRINNNYYIQLNDVQRNLLLALLSNEEVD